jgi:hypothetical protein
MTLTVPVTACWHVLRLSCAGATQAGGTQMRAYGRDQVGSVLLGSILEMANMGLRWGVLL